MKLSESTINIIKNFSTINQGLIFPRGSFLRTISGMQNIFATAVVEDEFPQTFAIYDLNEFLGTLSLFKNPDLEFFDNYFTIVDGSAKVKYYYCNPAVVFAPPDKEIKVNNPLVSFCLSRDSLAQIQKASAIMRLSNLVIEGSKLVLSNPQDSSNQYSIDTVMSWEAEDAMKRKFTVKIENLKLIPTDYDFVEVNNRLIHFSSTSLNLDYFIALDSFE